MLLILTLVGLTSYLPSDHGTHLAITGLPSDLDSRPAALFFFGASSGDRCPWYFCCNPQLPTCLPLQSCPQFCCLPGIYPLKGLSQLKAICGTHTFCPKWDTISQRVVLNIILVCSFPNSKNCRNQFLFIAVWGLWRCLLLLLRALLFYLFLFFKTLVLKNSCRCYSYRWETNLFWNK